MQITVRQTNNTYLARAGKFCASCTGGDELAAERLAEKLLGPWQRRTITRVVPEADHLVSRFLIVPDRAQVCRVCGCSYYGACEMPNGDQCWWVGPDLCSACALHSHDSE